MIQSHKKLKASLLVSAVLVVSLGAISPAPSAAASTSSSISATAFAVQTAIIQSSVRLRTAPSTSSNVLSYLSKGDVVTILEKTNNYFYKVRNADGEVGYTSSGTQYISLIPVPVTPTLQTALIQSSVRLRSAPSTSSKVLLYLSKDDVVTILEKTNDYFYKVRTAGGVVGYSSSMDQYIQLIPVKSEVPEITLPQPVPPVPEASPIATGIEDVIRVGMKYLGTPYEFGSSRSNSDTFDCSDFTRQIFLEGKQFQLPYDSRQQGDWIKGNSKAVMDVSSLKRGDLMFFMSYKGSTASAYAGIDKLAERITHVALYLGDGQMLHTYSVDSGGVKVDKLSASWMNRFLYGGSVIQ
ncbi:SH3 domain-containing C40 family peptidase [Paenibacillus wynnii]|uniref:Hydrolase n=1 Tax=Paenibacillus wynnii TaxID=268407 RepID=A0A098MEK4_9BACL|nr:SH3 domain-containing C40 family peptidase [Paenibacillus wynnii]KGE20974.1 hydrolase [Paenibacillus wynnii]